MQARKASNKTGSAYGLEAPAYDAAMTEVGPGTPCGEFLRRYWHPIGLTADATGQPRKLRVLAEDLIMFRDGGGRAGLVYPRCAHRGTTLYYGRIEERGIRCCYHGWLFDVEGHCLEQPCEPGGGKRKANVRQPWYPVEERYGLIWTYMGPPDRKPVLPRYDIFEALAPGEFLEADDSSLGSGGPAIVPCNWLQHWENVMDPLHVPILHGSFSGAQFVEQMALMPQVTWDYTPHGVRSVQIRKLEGAQRLRRVTEVILPALRVVPSPRLSNYGPTRSIGWTLPIDDATYRIYVVGKVREHGETGRQRSKFGGKTWFDLSAEEHRRMPGDYEAQVGQGAITFHSEEHLVSSDRGVSMLRRQLKRQIDQVAKGGVPAGVIFDHGSELVHIEAGNYLEGATS
ncbi:MAG: Rieske 2Fe-2S domain-containing protein [Candidatus Binataceae bacterium]